MYFLTKLNFSYKHFSFQISKLFKSTNFSDFSNKINQNKIINESQKQLDNWHFRQILSKPTIQRNENLPLKIYYSPEWKEAHENPLKKFGMTPEKWEFYNKVFFFLFQLNFLSL